MSAIRMRRNCCWPWLEDGPSELGNMPIEDTNELIPALVPRKLSAGGARVAGVGIALSRPVDFFFLTTMRDRRRWILDSKTLFCCTVDIYEPHDSSESRTHAPTLTSSRLQHGVGIKVEL